MRWKHEHQFFLLIHFWHIVFFIHLYQQHASVRVHEYIYVISMLYIIHNLTYRVIKKIWRKMIFPKHCCLINWLFLQTMCSFLMFFIHLKILLRLLLYIPMLSSKWMLWFHIWMITYWSYTFDSWNEFVSLLWELYSTDLRYITFFTWRIFPLVTMIISFLLKLSLMEVMEHVVIVHACLWTWSLPSIPFKWVNPLHISYTIRFHNFLFVLHIFSENYKKFCKCSIAIQQLQFNSLHNSMRLTHWCIWCEGFPVFFICHEMLYIRLDAILCYYKVSEFAENVPKMSIIILVEIARFSHPVLSNECCCRHFCLCLGLINIH